MAKLYDRDFLYIFFRNSLSLIFDYLLRIDINLTTETQRTQRVEKHKGKLIE